MTELSIPAADIQAPADLTLPARASGVILFVRSGASSRFSPRSRALAKRFQDAGLGTLLVDLVTPAEEAIDRAGRPARVDIDKLSLRLIGVTEWLQSMAQTAGFGIGYFATGRAAAVALLAAAHHPDHVSAVVCAGGRPDLAMEVLPKIRAATLLIIGGLDTRSAEFNRRAYAYLRCQRHLEVIAGTTHRFAEKGALERIGELATSWFLVYVPSLVAV